MQTNTRDILVFSKDCDFSDETNEILIANRNKCNVRFAETGQELAEFLKYIIKPKLIIYDSLYGNSEINKMISESLTHSSRLYCIYICERSDGELASGNDRVITLERPYSQDAYLEALTRFGVNSGSELADVETHSDPHDSQKSEVKIATYRLLTELGVPKKTLGYRYLGIAIPLVVYDRQLLHPITKSLYSIIAEKHQTTPGGVERAIRHTVEQTWEVGDIESLNKYFGYNVTSRRGKPTNTTFISVLADLMREQFFDLRY